MRSEVDSDSMKILLKQVYALHSSKLKGLEEEIENLRKNLQEAEIKLRNSSSECKRCIELEEAFNSCKSALHQQSKWLESLGQKFSTSDAAENGANVSHVRKESTINSPEQSNVSSSTKTHLLKNILNTFDFQDSLDLSCPPFQKKLNSDYSSLNLDSAVLVPNTVDIISDDQKKNDNAFDITTPKSSTNQKSNSNEKDVCRKVKKKELPKKRVSNESEKHDENEAYVNKKLKVSDKLNEKSEIPFTEQETDDSISSKEKTSDVSIKKTSFLKDSKNEDKNSIIGDASPSLIPGNEKCSAEDINDFQIASVAKKSTNEEGSWTSCDKRKLNKKVSNVKPIKTTSKFKMQLDALPPNFKKPVYKQTKLSKSIFQTKTLNSVEKDIESPPSTVSKTIDFDATCIPDNYEYEIVSSGNCQTESDEESSEIIIEQSKKSNMKDGNKEGDAMKSQVAYEIGNSFDRLPKKEEPKYKYKEETVRKKAERKQLTGFECNECEKYYAELGLSDEEKQRRMNKCSRHRAKFAPPSTPEHFWELDFPDTQECKARGYLNETQKGTLKSHRKRPL